ncbi:MAG TPA: hypothetical protein VMR50_06770 [Myxococcota bacterium]|nr:hypothetical protein [Myxococcota bacterium]
MHRGSVLALVAGPSISALLALLVHVGRIARARAMTLDKTEA